MKIDNSSTHLSSRLRRASACIAQAACTLEFAGKRHPRSFTGVASVIVIGGVLLTPLAASAQGEPAAPPTAAETESPEPTSDNEETSANAEQGAQAAAPKVEPAKQGAAAEKPVADLERDSIVVTGYRKSLKAALSKKKKATGQIDAIVAEDMAEMPDQNLAESLQRMPGVAIQRSNGEGTRITVRGLGSRYTRTRVNGMDTQAAVRGNSSRSFDFNMFASELFNSVVVHKTATAELGEGALGAVVDLSSARAFDYGKGFTVLVGAQGGYNSLSQSLFPRLTGLVSYHDPKGLWGATASVAYSQTRLDVAGTDTTRWQKAAFRSVNGVVCKDNPTDPNCVQVADAFHARIPRYGYSRMEGDRLGVTAGFQLRPTKNLEIRLDGLYSIYNTQQDFNALEVLFRGNEGTMDVTGFRLQQNPSRFGKGNNTLTALSIDNAWVRSEAYRQISRNDFKQATLAADLDVTDNFFITALGGISRSSSKIPHETTMMYDDRDYKGFSYDYANSQFPALRYGGADVTDPANFTLTELRDAVSGVEVGNETADLGFNWQALEQVKLSVGGTYKASRMSVNARNRNGSACRAGLNFNCDTDGDGMNDVLGPQGTADLSETFSYPGAVGGGSNSSWATPSLDGWNDQLGFYNLEAKEDLPGIRKVSEQSGAAYLQASGEVPLASMRLAYNAGARYVQTHQTSGGYISTEWVEVKRDPYSDVLPSANLALWLTDNFVTRVAGARVMSRPELGDLTPGKGLDAFNFKVSSKNPYLEPTRAWAGDLGAEWYFAPESVLSLAGFVKKIDSFPETESTTNTFASTGISPTLLPGTSPAAMNPEGTCNNPAGCWEITRLVNGGGAVLFGTEAGFGTPFNAFTKGLPVVLRDMGVTANYTYVHSRFPWDFSGTEVQERLSGLSTHSANATLYYDDSRFSLRGSLAWRGQYIDDGTANQNGNLFSFDEPPPRLDMSSSFKVTKWLQITAEALNVTNAPINTFVDIDARRRLNYGSTGRTFFLGARWSLGPTAADKEAKD